jgi:hypothetical protein
MIEVARGRLSKQIARDIGIAKGTAPARNCTAELEKASRFATLTPAGRGGRRVKSCHSDQSFQWGAIMYWKHVASVGVISLLLLPGHKAWADTGLGGFGYINEGPTTARPAPPPRSKRTKQKREIAIPVPPSPAPWGPVPTKQVSIVNVAPVLLPYFNNGPVFGVPGTVTGDFWSRTQVTGDWGGARTSLANMGVFLDVYTTSVYQDVTSGGLKTGGSFVQNIQTSLNVDTGRAGLWSGGLLHVTVQSRYGDSPANTFTAGTTIPQYTGLVYPGPTLWHDTLPAEYFFVQSWLEAIVNEACIGDVRTTGFSFVGIS